MKREDAEMIANLYLGMVNVQKIMSDHSSGRYILSSDEWYALPKSSQYERNFVNDMYTMLNFGELKELSPKREAFCLKLIDKLTA